MKKIIVIFLALALLVGSAQSILAVAPPVLPSSTPIPPKVEDSKNSINCVTGGGLGVRTAIGCVPINSSDNLIGFFLRWGLGIIGGIAFLLILVAGFQIMTSRGDPKKLQAGQELLTSAIAGVIMLIFSVFILKIIGVDILGISGF